MIGLMLALISSASCNLWPFGHDLTDIASITDGAHNAGNPHFFFLPPIVRQSPNFAGAFDGSGMPIVHICEWNGTACISDKVIARRDAPGTDPAITLMNEEYEFLLDTKQVKFTPGRTYRVRVVLVAAELGHFDLRVGSSNDIERFFNRLAIMLGEGETLRIRFRIEAGALGTGVLHTNPTDPVVATIRNGGGEVLQYLAEKDDRGVPTRYLGMRRFQSTNVSGGDALVLGANRLPEAIELRGGGRVVFSYPSPTSVRMTLVLPDGNSAVTSFDITAAPSSSFRAWRSQSGLAVQQPGRGVTRANSARQILVDVTAEVGGESEPIDGATVSGSWQVVGGEQFGSYIAHNVGAGVYTAQLPTIASEPKDFPIIEQTCGSLDDLVGDFCQALEDSGFDREMAASCIAFAPLGPEAVLACEAAVALVALSCAANTACDGFEAAQDLFVPDDKSLSVSCHVLTKDLFADYKVVTLEAPLPEIVSFSFKLPMLFGLFTFPPDPAPAESYVAVTEILPRMPNVAVSMSIHGTDGYEDFQSGVTNASGQFELYVPGAEAGVLDVITTTIGSRTKTVSIVF
jgi:hypothetical protein